MVILLDINFLIPAQIVGELSSQLTTDSISSLFCFFYPIEGLSAPLWHSRVQNYLHSADCFAVLHGLGGASSACVACLFTVDTNYACCSIRVGSLPDRDCEECLWDAK